MSWVAAFKARFYQSWPSVLWHRCVPHWTVSRRMGGYRVFFDLNDNIDDLTRGDFLAREAFLPFVASRFSGLIWDVGSNIGQFAVPMSGRGCQVVAFDISPNSCALLERTARENRLPITVVPRPLGMTPFAFAPPATSRPTEDLQPAAPGDAAHTAMMIGEAVAAHGMPALVKMDIEGAERDFFLSNAWREWIRTNRVHWLVELHTHRLDMSVVWKDMPMLRFDEQHALFHPSPERIAVLGEQWREFLSGK